MNKPSRQPAVLLASSRSGGNTAALVETAFPPGSAAVYDIGSMSIGYYSYDNANWADAFMPLIAKLLSHSSWVLATPLYWYTMSAQAKTFVDRLSDLTTTHKAIGRQLQGKSLSVICSGTDPALPPSFDEPLRLTCDYLGMRYLGSHYGRFEGRVHVSSTAAARLFAVEAIGCEGE